MSINGRLPGRGHATKSLWKCIHPDNTAVTKLPEPVDFMRAIVQKYGNKSNCNVYVDGLIALLKDAGVANDTHDHDHAAENHGDEHDEHDEHEEHDAHDEHDEHDAHDEHDDHEDHDDHDHGARRKRSTHDQDDHEDDHDDHGHGGSTGKLNVSSTCYSVRDYLLIYGLDLSAGIGRDQLQTVAGGVLQQITERACWEKPKQKQDNKPTAAQSYGYGTLAVAIISFLAVPGIVIVKWRRRPAYKYIMGTMLGLAVGTLVGDATLHLIPHALGLHDHESHDGHGHDHGHGHGHGGGITVEPFVWKMLVANIALYGFFALQVGLGFMAKNKTSEIALEPRNGDIISKEKGSGRDNKAYQVENGDVITPAAEKTHSHFHQDTALQIATPEFTPEQNNSLGWMVTIGDAIHNFADGLAIGAAFSLDVRSGISTSIAVAFHELPHELGDIAAMLSIGWSARKVLLFNTMAAVCAFGGLYVGIPVSQNAGAREWIMVVTAGMFLYVALCDIVPELLELIKKHGGWLVLASSCGILVGLGIMLIIAIFEEHIKV